MPQDYPEGTRKARLPWSQLEDGEGREMHPFLFWPTSQAPGRLPYRDVGSGAWKSLDLKGKTSKGLCGSGLCLSCYEHLWSPGNH